MTRKEVRRLVEERLSWGYSRQQVFDELRLQGTGLKDARLAELIRYRPSLQARERYGRLNNVLLGLIVAYGLIQLLRPLLAGPWEQPSAYRLLTILPIATVFLGYAVYRFRGEAYTWLALINLWSSLAILRGLTHVKDADPDPWTIAKRVLSLAIAGLALYLANRLFPRPKKERDPLGEGAVRFVFPPDGIR
ncbi:MAG TPA: hypothetical protein VGE21_09130 [Flavobacteriales bacterium]